MAYGTKTIKVDASETERVLSDYVITRIARELNEYAGEGRLPDASRLFGISVDLQFVEDVVKQIRGEND